jgi:hypothetical protein
MAKWKINAEDGRSWTIVAPDNIPEADVLEFADASKDSWVNGATYQIAAEQPAAPAASPRNQAADAKSAELRQQIAELQEQFAPARRYGGPAADPLGPVTGMAPAANAAEVLTDRAGQQKQLETLQAELDKLNLGATGQTVGGIGGALVGGGLAAALTRNPSAVATGARIGASIGGASLGVGAGTKLHDIAEVKKARDLSDEEVSGIIRGRMVESVLWDGAFVVLLGPGGALLGKLTDGQKFLPALKAVAKDASSWGAIPDARKEQLARVVEKRAELAPPGLATQASDALDLPRSVPDTTATRNLIADVAEKTGGHVPTTGEMTGMVSSAETTARKLAPQPFFVNDRILSATAQEIRDTALRDLDNVGAYTGADFGDAIRFVAQSADTSVKRVTGPIFQQAAKQNLTVNMRGPLNYLEGVLFKDLEGLGLALREDRAAVERIAAKLKEEPFVSMEGAQTAISGLKALQRETRPDGSQPSEFIRGVWGKLIEETDSAFLATAKQADPILARNLVQARNLYRVTMQDIYSDAMAKVLKDTKSPEDVITAFTAPRTVTEIRELRQALDRAYQGAPTNTAYTGSAARPVTELGKEAVAQQRARIDAGLVKHFIEKNTQSLTDLDTRLKDPDFRQTLRELLIGPGVADPVLGRKVLGELNRTLGVIKLIKPETAPQPGRVMLPGVSTTVSSGTAGKALTGSAMGAFAIVLGVIPFVRMTARAAAHAMTTGNMGAFRTIQRAAMLSRAAGQNPAAAEALRAALQELDAWDREQGGPGLAEEK